MKTILLLMIVLFILLSDFTLSIQLRNTKYELKYNGLVWVSLDCYSIIKYKSNHNPMKVLQLSCKTV